VSNPAQIPEPPSVIVAGGDGSRFASCSVPAETDALDEILANAAVADQACDSEGRNAKNMSFLRADYTAGQTSLSGVRKPARQVGVTSMPHHFKDQFSKSFFSGSNFKDQF
jgi:hypothetical protein